jgi:hypothetical protein
VGYCATWIAKALHENLVGWWPGLQHCSAATRVERNRPYEFCGCGKSIQYRFCCRSKDLTTSWIRRNAERSAAELRYLDEIARRSLSPQRPDVVIEDHGAQISELFAPFCTRELAGNTLDCDGIRSYLSASRDQWLAS